MKIQQIEHLADIISAIEILIAQDGYKGIELHEIKCVQDTFETFLNRAIREYFKK